MSTPIDYLRIMTKLDGGNHRPDLLSEEGLNIFYADSVVVADDAWNVSDAIYLKGLMRNNAASRWEHNGNLSGPIAEYLRYDDGFSIMAVINQRRPQGPTEEPPTHDLKGLVIDIYEANISYPPYDLF